MATNPFANAGLGMFGRDVEMAKSENASSNPIELIASLIAHFKGLPTEEGQSTASIPGAKVPSFEPQSAFPEVFQQNYNTPYGVKPNVAPFKYGVDPSKNMAYQQYSMTQNPMNLNQSLWE